MEWPRHPDELEVVQRHLADLRPELWRPGPGARPGGCFVCFQLGAVGPGERGERGWAAAATVGSSGRTVGVVEVAAGAPYRAGWLALREGPGLEKAVGSLPAPPDVLLVDATGRDHPRRGGLALHLGAVIDLPTVGVTHRPLLAAGSWPELSRGARSPLRLDGDLVGYWVCTRAGRRPLAVHAGWRTDPDSAVELVLAATGRFRTPEPLRMARQAARQARTTAGGR